MILATSLLHAQVKPASSRIADVQVGGTFNLSSSDYGPGGLYGLGAYATADFKPHLGIELSLQQLFDPGSSQKLHLSTYQIGPRYVLHYGRFEPYAKLLVGRGVFQFPPDPVHPTSGPAAVLAYTIWTPGIGTDFKLSDHLNLRLDYEFQQWPGFPPHGLSPESGSLGIAWHF